MHQWLSVSVVTFCMPFCITFSRNTSLICQNPYLSLKDWNAVLQCSLFYCQNITFSSISVKKHPIILKILKVQVKWLRTMWHSKGLSLRREPPHWRIVPVMLITNMLRRASVDQETSFTTKHLAEPEQTNAPRKTNAQKGISKVLCSPRSDLSTSKPPSHHSTSTFPKSFKGREKKHSPSSLPNWSLSL